MVAILVAGANASKTRKCSNTILENDQKSQKGQVVTYAAIPARIIRKGAGRNGMDETSLGMDTQFLSLSVDRL